ncbi:hypothetical protein PENTCL1PPCAC_21494, partial [Pristionchus entomophagus]
PESRVSIPRFAISPCPVAIRSALQADPQVCRVHTEMVATKIHEALCLLIGVDRRQICPEFIIAVFKGC